MVKSLVVALAEAKPVGHPDIADLQDWTKKLAHTGRSIDGALELAYRRGEHAGYLAGYNDAKRKRKNKYARTLHLKRSHYV